MSKRQAYWQGARHSPAWSLSSSSSDVRLACRAFDPLWDTLTQNEQWRILSLLLGQVEFDADQSSIDVTFHPTGVKQLNREIVA